MTSFFQNITKVIKKYDTHGVQSRNVIYAIILTKQWLKFMIKEQICGDN